tara:strand:+ start:207 stop:422 length:216 start_codon:yes stop_codon:yes gene_type:complete
MSGKNIDWEDLLGITIDQIDLIDISKMDHDAKNYLFETLYSEYLSCKSNHNTQTLLMYEKMLSTLIKMYGH